MATTKVVKGVAKASPKKVAATPKVVAKKPAPKVDKYDKIHRDMMDMILSGEMHATLIGMQVSVGSGSGGNLREIEEFVEYTIKLLKKAEQFGKDNVTKRVK